MENMKQFVRDFNRRQPISAMALSYLFDKGAQGILNATEEEYSAGIDRAIAEAEANHHVYFMTKDVAIQIFRLAKEFATVEPIDLVTAIGNGVYNQKYTEAIYGPEASEAVEGKAVCPYCGKNLFIVEDGNIEDGSARYKCLSCEGTFNTDEIVIQVGEA